MNAAKHYAMPQTSGSRCSSSYCLFAGLCAGVSAARQTGGLRWLGLGYQHSVGSAVVVVVLVVVSVVVVVVVTCLFASLCAGVSAAHVAGGLRWLGYHDSVGPAVVVVVLVVVVLVVLVVVVVLVLVLVVVSAVLVVVVTCVFAGLSVGLSAARQTGGLGWLGD